MLKAVKVRIYPTDEQQAYLAQAFGCVRWVWNQSLSVMSLTYKETGKGVSAYDMKKQIPVWKKEHEWLKECYSQCLQQSVLNLSQALINFFEGRTAYPSFKHRHGRQSIQYPANVKILSKSEVKFPGKLGTVKAKIHRDCVGKLKTVTVSRMTDGRYYASLLLDDGIEKPELSNEGKAIGVDLGLIDFAVTSDGSKFNNPKHLKKHERNLKRKQRKLSRKKDRTTNKRRKAKVALAKVHHDRDVNAAINIRNEGLRILALGTSATALGGNVRPKRFGRKSTTVEAIADELGSQHHTA